MASKTRGKICFCSNDATDMLIDLWSEETIQFALESSKTTGSPSSLGAVNMTLRNSVIIRVCMGIQRSYKIFQTKGKKIIKSTYLSCCLFNLWFYVVWRGFRAISVGFSFSVFFSL